MLLQTEKLPDRKRNRRLKDYAGERFGRLTAIKLVERDPVRNDHKWQFVCDCGNSTIASIKNVRSGNTSSCGCIRSSILADRNTKHGLSREYPREYRSWKDMRARCSNPRNTDFHSYGGRGIRICSRWDDFAIFLGDMGRRPVGMTLDRIDVNGDYEPANCRWATDKTQANNKRTNRLLAVNGTTKTLQEWSDLYGIDRTKLIWRLDQGWPMEQVFSKEDMRTRYE